MIAEYERAQILERSRRGKRHRARAGEISVMSGAPYGYRYLRKRDDVRASYAVVEAEARVVRDIYEHYTITGWSIEAICRWQRARLSHAESRSPLGALDGAADAAQPGNIAFVSVL